MRNSCFWLFKAINEEPVNTPQETMTALQHTLVPFSRFMSFCLVFLFHFGRFICVFISPSVISVSPKHLCVSFVEDFVSLMFGALYRNV